MDRSLYVGRDYASKPPALSPITEDLHSAACTPATPTHQGALQGLAGETPGQGAGCRGPAELGALVAISSIIEQRFSNPVRFLNQATLGSRGPGLSSAAEEGCGTSRRASRTSERSVRVLEVTEVKKNRTFRLLLFSVPKNNAARSRVGLLDAAAESFTFVKSFTLVSSLLKRECMVTGAAPTASRSQCFLFLC